MPVNPLFTYGGTKAQRSYVTCPGPHNYLCYSQDSNLSMVISKCCVISPIFYATHEVSETDTKSLLFSRVCQNIKSHPKENVSDDIPLTKYRFAQSEVRDSLETSENGAHAYEDFRLPLEYSQTLQTPPSDLHSLWRFN